MHPSEVFAASTLQKARAQELGHGAPIRSVVLPAACRSPQELLRGPLPGAAMERSLSDVLTFQPQIRKPRKSQVPPEHLRDRVVQTRLLDDSLKADCLERLAGAAQRAPMVRRASWSDVAPPPPPESDDEVIEFTKEDLFKEDAPKKPPDATEAEPSAMSREELGSEMPSEPSAPSERREVPSAVPAMNLTELLAENEKLRAAAGLSENEHFSWRPGGTTLPETGPLADVRRKRRGFELSGAEAKDFYADWSQVGAAGLHWHYKGSSPFRRRSKMASKTPSASVEVLPPLEAVPIPAAALEDARQAEQQQQHAFCIAAPGAMKRRSRVSNFTVFTEQGIEWAKLAKGACALRSAVQKEVPLDLTEDGFVATALAPFGIQLRKQTESPPESNAVLSKKVINEVLAMSSDPGLQLPLEVKYWTRQQLEVFVMSGGVLRPKNCSMPDERLLANASMSKDEVVHSLAQAAEWIANADALLIGSGAGMGVDSGLGTFRGGKKGVWDGLEAVGLAYEEICEPRWFDEASGDPRLAWGFWNHCYRAYQETKPHQGYGALRQLGMQDPIAMLVRLIGSFWNYMFDVPLRQAREFQVQNVNLARFALFREDIRDLGALTTDKVANLLVVNTLKVGFIVALYFNFDRTDSGFQARTYQEDQLAVLLGMTLLTSFFFLMTSIWFAMHAFQLSQAITTKLLVQVVRIPMPSEYDIAKASTEGRDFELNFREALRLPFLRPTLDQETIRDHMKDVSRQFPLSEEVPREDSRLTADTQPASPRSRAPSYSSPKPNGPPTNGTPLLQTTKPVNRTVTMQELLHCLPPHAERATSEMEPHLKLLCLVASAWQPFDLYSRVTTVLGSSCLFSGLAYFSLYYNRFDVDGGSGMPTEAWCSFLFMSTLAWWNLTIEIAGSKLDLFIAALLILVGPTLWVASNKPTLHSSVMRHFGYPVLVTIQASWICFLGIRAFTCGGEWPHFFTSTRYLNVVHKQRGPIEIPADIARKVTEDEDSSTESSINYKESQHAMAIAQPLIDVLSLIADLPQSSSSRAAVFQARDWLREAARAAGVLRTSLTVKGFWVYLPMSGLDNEGSVPHWVDVNGIDYADDCRDATEAFMLPELLQAADMAAESLHAQAVRWTVHDMLRLASYGGEPVTGVNSFLFQFENISDRMRTFVPSADHLFKVAMGLVSLFWVMVWVWSILAATELFQKVSLSGTMQQFTLDTPWRTVTSFGCTLEGEHYVVTDSIVVQILSEEGNVWLEFGACDGAPVLAVDFGQQGEVIATCQKGIQTTWLAGAQVQEQFWVSNVSGLQDFSVDRSPLEDPAHLDAIAIRGEKIIGLRHHPDSSWREVGILNVPPVKGHFSAVAVRRGRALLLTSVDEMYELDVPSGVWAGPMLLPNKNNADSYDWVSMCRLTHGRWRFLGHPNGLPMQMWRFERPPVNALPPREDPLSGLVDTKTEFPFRALWTTAVESEMSVWLLLLHVEHRQPLVFAAGIPKKDHSSGHGALTADDTKLRIAVRTASGMSAERAPADHSLAEDPQTHRVQGVLPTCPKCKAVARPNVQMFGGDSGFSRARRGAQNTRYDAWVNGLASRPDVNSLSVVCLEVGCGLTVPTVRRELEKVVQRFPGGRLIRVNPENPGLAKELVEKGVSVPLPASAAIEKLSQQVAQTEETMQATYVLWGVEGGCEIRAPFGTCLGRLLRLVETQGRMTVDFKPDVVGIVKQAMGPRTEPITLEKSVPMDMYQEVKLGEGSKLEVTAILRVMAKFSGGSSSVGGFSLNAPLAKRVDQVCKLLDEVNTAFSQPEYQKAAESCEDRRSLLKETRNIQFEILPKYDIEATDKGTSIMAAWISSAQNGIKDVDDKVIASMHLSRMAYASKLPLAKNKAKEAAPTPVPAAPQAVERVPFPEKAELVFWMIIPIGELRHPFMESTLHTRLRRLRNLQRRCRCRHHSPRASSFLDVRRFDQAPPKAAPGVATPPVALETQGGSWKSECSR
ncbi:unnamed protein product [Symbiodinium natans]|uniref:Uncharacterized protein n=1 Tax=Symbiodinium natans TaxID=878477 RepID=A0A812MSQ6_9DINO|nr:unnamed protein product [Symbiodinium natans]